MTRGVELCTDHGVPGLHGALLGAALHAGEGRRLGLHGGLERGDALEGGWRLEAADEAFQVLGAGLQGAGPAEVLVGAQVEGKVLVQGVYPILV